ncbi:hypothetical protein SJAG_03791 [Schizosaccharomyces japonicus yFS275]|uniref:Uncharacterized protein n=1 Tax=Schizosaccharomyces japonicus (strain yFS275 / FY16936) TaxID=402676 RepID=B6K525_SCHJY|nr:hypothetical protein SJAG_03791 [Schizosaccharomyces japonicus yFS275]EEB08629.1 hypothetical protein SJAG_03791 [Schizosaccharomyces japonicus yFS275]
MVVHQDKWKKKATLAYKKKHNIPTYKPKPQQPELESNEWRFENAPEFFGSDEPAENSIGAAIGDALDVQEPEEEIDYSKLNFKPTEGIFKKQRKKHLQTIQRDSVSELLETVEYEKTIDSIKKRYNVERERSSVATLSKGQDFDSFLEELDGQSDALEKQINKDGGSSKSNQFAPIKSKKVLEKDQAWLDALLQ